jgi:hypothetical protein
MGRATTRWPARLVRDCNQETCIVNLTVSELSAFKVLNSREPVGAETVSRSHLHVDE